MDSCKTESSEELTPQTTPQKEEQKDTLFHEHPQEPQQNAQYIPTTSKEGQNQDQNYQGPFLIRKKTTIQQDKVISTEKNPEEDQDITICKICNNILQNPLECSQCRNAFCKDCIDEYKLKGLPKCPKGCEYFKFILAHPLIQKSLNKLIVECENKPYGCKEKVPYPKLQEHLLNCDYQMVRCSNFGCTEEVPKIEYDEHFSKCRYRQIKCKRCETLIQNDEDDHDCVASLKSRFDIMERMIYTLNQKLETQEDRIIQQTSIKLMRKDYDLPAFKTIFFRPEIGLLQTVKATMTGLPDNTKALIIKFTLADINVRRYFNNLDICQEECFDKINLSQYFYVGNMPIPSLGLSTEVFLPWCTFQNGKIVCKEGSYYLERTRYHDKLNPNQEHDVQLQKQLQPGKKKKHGKDARKSTSSNANGTNERRPSMIPPFIQEEEENQQKTPQENNNAKRDSNKSQSNKSQVNEFLKIQNLEKTGETQQDKQDQERKSPRRLPKLIPPQDESKNHIKNSLNIGGNNEQQVQQETDKQPNNFTLDIIIQQTTKDDLIQKTNKDRKEQKQDEKIVQKTGEQHQQTQEAKCNILTVRQMTSDERLVNEEVSKKVLEQELAIRGQVFSTESNMNLKFSNRNVVSVLDTKEDKKQISMNILSDSAESVSNSERDYLNSESKQKQEQIENLDSLPDFEEEPRYSNNKNYKNQQEEENFNTQDLNMSNAQDYVKSLLKNV